MRQAAFACAALASAATACAPRSPPALPALPAPPPPPSEPPLDDPAACADPVDVALVALNVARRSGRLEPDRIRDVLRSHHASIQDCYELGLARHPALRGRVTFRFAIEQDGQVSQLQVSDNALPDCRVVACIRSRFAHIQFPPPDGGIVMVQYPVTLEAR